MYKFDSIIKNYIFPILNETNAEFWEPEAPVWKNSQTSKMGDVNSSTDISISLPPPWNRDQCDDFFYNLDNGDMLGALSILINDPSLKQLFNVEQLKNNVDLPLNNILSSIGQQFSEQTEQTEENNGEISSSSENVPKANIPTTTTLSPKNQVSDVNDFQIANILTTAKLIANKTRSIFSEQTMKQIISNFNTVTDENGIFKYNKPLFDVWSKKAAESGWQSELQDFISSFSSNNINNTSSEKFENVINDYKNLNRLDEIVGGIVSSIVVVMTKILGVSVASSIIDIFGFIFSRGITMPLRIFMLIIDKLKKYKNFLLGIFMPVQVVSGVIINSGEGKGEFTGPMAQEILQKVTDFALELTTDILNLLGVDKLLSNASNMGKGSGSIIKSTLRHQVTPSKNIKAITP